MAWNKPASLVYGTPLSASQLNPASAAAGTVSFSPGAGTLLHAGLARTLTASFTPADRTKYTSASIQTTIDVAPAALTVAIDSKTMTCGGVVPALTLAFTGWVNGDGLTSDPRVRGRCCWIRASAARGCLRGRANFFGKNLPRYDYGRSLK